MGAFLGQLVNCLSSEHTIVKELIECRLKKKLLDLKTSVDYVRRIVSTGRFTCVRLGADGLDELLPEHRTAFLASLGSLSALSNIRLLYFGRDNSGIQTDIGNSLDGPDSSINQALTPENTADDRKLFLQQCLDRSRDWRILDDGLTDMIFSQLAGPESTSVFLLTVINND
jgi:hypothetical protein